MLEVGLFVYLQIFDIISQVIKITSSLPLDFWLRIVWKILISDKMTLLFSFFNATLNLIHIIFAANINFQEGKSFFFCLACLLWQILLFYLFFSLQVQLINAYHKLVKTPTLDIRMRLILAFRINDLSLHFGYKNKLKTS